MTDGDIVLAFCSTTHGYVRLWHEYGDSPIEGLPESADVMLTVAFGRTDSTHRIPAGVYRSLLRQLQGDPEVEDLMQALRHIALGSTNSMTSKEDLGKMARKALRGRKK